MKIIFYITNHGFGHASRNVPIIETLLLTKRFDLVFVKSDQARCDFLKKNLLKHEKHICYFADCLEAGLILHIGSMQYDSEATEEAARNNLASWPNLIEQEKQFILEHDVDIVVSDTVAWPLESARRAGIPSVLIGNFSWARTYQSIGISDDIWKRYEEYYMNASKAIWYDIHEKCLEEYCENTVLVSMVSRKRNSEEIARIKSRHKQPIVFISLGASAEISNAIDVSGLPYDILFTRGISFIGENAFELPHDMINTPDYIAAADYIVVKGGWSTVAEVMLQNKPAAMLFRGDFSEDNETKKTLIPRDHCIEVTASDITNLRSITERLDSLHPASFGQYTDDVVRICEEIVRTII